MSDIHGVQWIAAGLPIMRSSKVVTDYQYCSIGAHVVVPSGSLLCDKYAVWRYPKVCGRKNIRVTTLPQKWKTELGSDITDESAKGALKVFSRKIALTPVRSPELSHIRRSHLMRCLIQRNYCPSDSQSISNKRGNQDS